MTITFVNSLFVGLLYLGVVMLAAYGAFLILKQFFIR